MTSLSAPSQRRDVWLEFAGEVDLTAGWAEVALDEHWAATIDTSSYLVFLTSYDAGSVFVQNRTPRSFEIHATSVPGRRGHATVHCAYRVMGRPKAPPA
ncbi:MAG: hypothetical protein OEX23_12830 [Betaproteobacteria bacterium]|nr:hypothetical protein [Betaproteobacteria bacterium]